MTGSNVTQTMRRRLRYIVPLALAAIVGMLMVLGCNGGGDSKPLSMTGLWQKEQQDATYVGKTACRDCHANVYDQYVQSAMGNIGVTTADSRHAAADCRACHVTGLGEATGGKLDGSTPKMDGIGCESCHGPGSKHIGSESHKDRKNTITRTPPDKTCADCHGGRLSTPDGYRPGALNQPFTPITAEYLAETAPGTVRGPHYAPAAFLQGWDGYGDTAPMASPHASLPNTCQNCHQKKISPATGKIDHGVDCQEPDTNTNRPACSSCHGGRSGSLIQTGVNTKLIELIGADTTGTHYDPSAAGGLLAAYATTHGIAMGTNDAKADPHVIAYKAARHNVRYVISDHSLGVHNPAFALHLLEKAKELLESAP